MSVADAVTASDKATGREPQPIRKNMKLELTELAVTSDERAKINNVASSLLIKISP
jgi:hypothetical protein